MKRFLTSMAVVCLVAAAFAADTKSNDTFTGEISDSQCALNVHSTKGGHEEMLKGGMTGKTNADCVRFCVDNMGGKYVLASKSAVYRLDDAKKVAPFAGQKVVVHGALDKKTNTIAVASIDTAK